MKKAVIGLCAVLFLGGCVNYQYSGKKADQKTANVSVFSDSAKISRPYVVLGEATVSGNYLQTSRDRLMEKLLSEGKKCGADAILIVEQQVVPFEKHSTLQDQGFRTAFDYDDSNANWSQLYRDVDNNFGSIRPKKEKPQVRDLASYKRVIRAEFLQYTHAAELKPAEQDAPAPLPSAEKK